MSAAQITGGADDATAAAILAAVARLDEERAELASRPRTSPRQSLWVLSGRPRPVQRVFATEEPGVAPGWSVGAADEEGAGDEA
ncbi:MAG: hypothetical protein R3290_06555 [Acidimicrobiia bacterium]|nr:hypothetical protein [Acidimicrobiia bacterium]